MHLGVAMSCLSWEGAGQFGRYLEWKAYQNRSRRKSAMQCVRRCSELSVLHNDIELRSFVQRRENPERAKVVDFRACHF